MAFQGILSIAGIVLLVVAIGLGIFAFHVFRRNDIPSVIADLTGRSRQLDIDGQDTMFGHAPHAYKKTFREQRAGLARVGERQPGNGFHPDAQTGVIERSEYVADAPTGAIAGADRSAEVLAEDLDQPTTILLLDDVQEGGRDADGETTVLTIDFVVKRSELMIDSDVVIAVGRGDE